MNIQTIKKRSNTINDNPLPNSFILHDMMGVNKSYEKTIEIIALQIFHSQDITHKELSVELFSNIFTDILGMMVANPENGVKILRRVFNLLGLLSRHDYIAWAEKNNQSIVTTSRTILIMTLAWFHKVREGSQDDFDKFIFEVIIFKRQNLSALDLWLLDEANDEVNQMLWN